MSDRKLILAAGEREPEGGSTISAEYEQREFTKLQAQRRIGAAVVLREVMEHMREMANATRSRHKAQAYSYAEAVIESRIAKLEGANE